MRTKATLYEQDFYAWLEVTAGLLRAASGRTLMPIPLRRNSTPCARRKDGKPYGASDGSCSTCSSGSINPQDGRPGTRGARRSGPNGPRSRTCWRRVPRWPGSCPPSSRKATRSPGSGPVTIPTCPSLPSRRPARGHPSKCWIPTFFPSPKERPGVAPQLTVVSAPPLNQALERMRGTPTLLGWCPTRRWHMKRQQFLDGPAMIRDASSHRRCGPATGVGQTRMRCAKIIDRTDQIHAMLQRQRAARQRATSACQRGQTLTERRVAAARCRPY